ncbi:MAG: hypothetical protein V7K26_22125 [Nostoc sp.]|uniref:hypothetical protein n=1 Tax=Nostoc sp. TaxID=1180 RepID=UPI002FEE9538
MEKIYRVATVAGVEILRQRQLKHSVPDLRRVSAETFCLVVERSRNTASCLVVERLALSVEKGGETSL